MDTRLGKIEGCFADLIWELQPVTTRELIKQCSERFEWKRTTTYTVLKKLCNKGLFKTEDGIVTALISRDEYSAAKSTQFIDDFFSGSLPAFLNAFSAAHKLNDDELKELQKMIDLMKSP